MSALASYWLYKSDKLLREQSIWLPRILGLFRFLSLSFIAFFLLEPLIRTETREVQQPIIAILLDNSESILNGSDSSYYKSELPNEIKALALEFGDSYEVELFSFDDAVKRGLDQDYRGKMTDLSNVMSDLETRYYNRNLAAVILASDGNYNKGINPIYLPLSLNTPFYTVLLGDTGKISDIAIKEIINNSISFLGDEFPVEINLSGEGMNGEDYTLEITNNGQKVFEQKGKIDNEQWFKSIKLLLPANKTGVQRYNVSLKTSSEERVKQNNNGLFYITILDERLKIAIITSAPHPDVAVWAKALKKNKNYELSIFEADKFNQNINDFSLFILYQVPSKISQTALIDQIKSAKIPYLLQIGLNTNINLLNQVLDGEYSFKTEATVKEDFKAMLNNSFSLFTIDQRLKDNQYSFPPFTAPFISVSSNQVYQKLLTKQIGQMDSGLPIWILSESAYPKSGIIIGEGLWRWSVNAYSVFENHDVFDDFLQQSVKYLIRKGGNSRFELELEKEYFEGIRIKLNASLLNPSMEKTSEGSIDFTLINERNENFEYAFIESGGNYSLDLGVLEAGDYSFKALAELGEERFTKNGKFTIKKMMLEQKDTRANVSLMYQWADKTGGALYFPNQLNEIQTDIKKSNSPSISYQSEQFSDMIRLSWLMFIIVLFLSIEWFLRRFYGSY